MQTQDPRFDLDAPYEKWGALATVGDGRRVWRFRLAILITLLCIVAGLVNAAIAVHADIPPIWDSAVSSSTLTVSLWLFLLCLMGAALAVRLGGIGRALLLPCSLALASMIALCAVFVPSVLYFNARDTGETSIEVFARISSKERTPVAGRSGSWVLCRLGLADLSSGERERVLNIDADTFKSLAVGSRVKVRVSSGNLGIRYAASVTSVE